MNENVIGVQSKRTVNVTRFLARQLFRATFRVFKSLGVRHAINSGYEGDNLKYRLYWLDQSYPRMIRLFTGIDIER